MKKFFINCDFIGPKPILYYNKKTRYRTKIGALLSIIFLILIISFDISFFYFYINNKIKIIYETYENKGNFSLQLNNNSIRFKVVDSNYKTIESNFIQIIPFYSVKNSEIEELYELNTTSCDVNDINLYKNLNSENFICLSNKNNIKYTIINNFKHDNYSLLKFFISKCTNNTENNICSTYNEIQAFLIKNDLKVLLFIDDYQITNNNKNYILQTYYTEINIVQDLYYEYNLNFDKIIYKIDEGVFFPNIKKKYFHSINKNQNNFKINSYNYQSYYPNSLMEINIQLNGDFIKNIHQEHIKFPEFLSQIVCFTYIIYKIFHITCQLLYKGKMFTEMMDVNEIINTNLYINEKLNIKNNNHISQKIPSNKIGNSYINNLNNSSSFLHLSSNTIGNNNLLKNINNINNNINQNDIQSNKSLQHNNNSINIDNSIHNDNSIHIVNSIKNINSFHESTIIHNNNHNKNNSNQLFLNIMNPKIQSNTFGIINLKKVRKIDYCSSFLYNINCINSTSNKKIDYILLCELIVKQIISSDEIIRKFIQLELILLDKINEERIKNTKVYEKNNFIQYSNSEKQKNNNQSLSKSYHNSHKDIVIIKEEDENN